MKYLTLFFIIISSNLYSIPTDDKFQREKLSSEVKDIRSFRLQLSEYVPDVLETSENIFHSKSLNVDENSNTPSRSPFLAGLLSLIVPGAGEIYSESYLKAGIFIIAEAAFWYFNITNNNKGDDQSVLFQNYADTHWSVVRYAEWLNKFRTVFKGGDQGVDISIDPNSSLPPWERVDWNSMNKTESVIPEFSHRLPQHGDQQYFELIGKYQQYNHGWDDSDPNTSVYYTNITQNFHYYSSLRGKANNYYNTAETFAALIVVNHILSAIDAAWSASMYNSRYQFSSHIELYKTPVGYEPIPTASLTIKF